LRLPCFAGLGAKTVDEGLQMLALCILLFDHFLIEHEPFAALAFKGRIVPAIEHKFARFQRQDVTDRIVEQIAIMANDNQG